MSPKNWSPNKRRSSVLKLFVSSPIRAETPALSKTTLTPNATRYVIHDHQYEPTPRSMKKTIIFQMEKIQALMNPRKKTSLAGSHAYNPIRDSRRDVLARKVLPTVWPKVLPRVLLRVLPRLSVRLLARLFAPKSLAKSLGSDYMHDSRRDSPRDWFFLRGKERQVNWQQISRLKTQVTSLKTIVSELRKTRALPDSGLECLEAIADTDCTVANIVIYVSRIKFSYLFLRFKDLLY